MNYLFIHLFNYEEYKISKALYQTDIVNKKLDKIENYVKNYLIKNKYTDPNFL